ncbi:MAG TPA: Fur family transcriptional regulator [Chloroflexota bacterium]
MGHPDLTHLRQGNHRLTPQRRMIWELLHGSHQHLTAEQLHAAAVEHLPDLSEPTVYRTLADLVDAGHVREIAVPRGPSWYETICADDQHSDQVCTACGQVEKLRDVPLERAARVATEGRAFVADDVHLVLYGTCERCRTAAPQARSLRRA